ncbi:MAG TPA: TrmH family RNA methyltransferase [Rubricoccaceae bacterium]|nr:TrmH family RNA methyltransferase [Rubricoccaceae bacterium]
MPLHPISVVLPDVRSAYNVGSIFRTADAAGLAHVYLTGYTPTPAHRGVKKTALGAETAVPWSQHDDALGLVERLRAEGQTVVALERTPRAVGLEQVGPEHFPMVVVVGNEVAGVPPALLGVADLVLALPVYGVKTSLNVAVAFGVAAYGLVGRYRADS